MSYTTMNCILPFCIWTVWFLQRVSCKELEFTLNSELDKYLNERRDELYSELLVNSITKRETEDVEVNMLKQIVLPSADPLQNVTLFSYKGDVYLVYVNNLFRISNSTYTLEQIDRFDITNDDYVVFLKVAEFELAAIIFLRTRAGNSYVYSLTDNGLSFVQFIHLPFFQDCDFFTNGQSLYFAVVNRNAEELADLVLYKWLGTHLDQFETKFTRAATKILSFTTPDNAGIITFHDQSHKKYIQVYEFHNDGLRQVQYIPITGAVNVDRFRIRNNTYITIINEFGNNSVYQVKGSHLKKSFDIKTEKEIRDAKIVITTNQAVLVNPDLNKVQIYYVDLDKVQLVAQVRYNLTFTEILANYNWANGDNISTFIVGRGSDTSINISVIFFKINPFEIDSTEDPDALRTCLESLEARAYANQDKLTDVELLESKTGLELDELVSESQTKEADIDDVIVSIKEALKDQQAAIEHYNASDGNTLVINGNVTFQGNITVDKLRAKEMSFKKLNNRRWTPQEWLKYKEPQTITGPVKISSATMSNLFTSPEDSLFTDMLLKSGNQTITAPVKLQVITARSIDAGNSRKTPSGIFQRESAEEPFIPKDGNVHIENLIVQEINGVNWDEFVKSVVLFDETTEINSSISFTKLVADKLTLRTLNNVSVEDFFTTTTNQVIQSDIEFNTIYAKDVNTNTTNGVKLADECVTIKGNVTVTGPVTFEQLNVVRNLSLIGKMNESLFLTGDGHILGTNETELLQRYMGKVKIKGDLHLKNVNTLSSTILRVSDAQVTSNISETYWTKGTHQVVPVNVTFLGELTVPHLLTELLNGVNFDQYMADNSNDKFETSYIFEDVEVLGDVTLTNNNVEQRPNLIKIDKEAVKTTGVYNIHGRKQYRNSLTAKNLICEELAGVDASNILNNKMRNLTITGTKTFKNLTVKGNFIVNGASQIDQVQGIKVKEFLDDIVYVDRNENISMLDFKHVNASGLKFAKLNGKPLEVYREKLNKIIDTGTIKTLFIHTDVVLNCLQNVSIINNFTMEELTNNVMQIGPFGIKNNIKFKGKVKINNLLTITINNINMKKLFGRILNRKWNQTILAPWIFGNVKAENINTFYINDYIVDNLIDVSSKIPQVMYMPNGTTFKSLINVPTLSAPNMVPCSLEALLEHLNDPPSQTWKRVDIKGNATVLDENSLTYRVLEKGVKKGGVNVIESSVTLNGDILVENIETSKNINNVNISEIQSDAVLSESDEDQHVSGQKRFVSLRATSAVVLKNADIPVVNGEDVKRINEEIVSKDTVPNTVVRGRKIFFGGLQSNYVVTKKLGDLRPEEIVQLDSDRPIAKAIFDYVEVESNLEVKNVNNMSLLNILENRILINGPMPQTIGAVMYFDHMEVQNLSARFINEVNMDEVVFDIGEQNVFAPKIFTRELEVFGNVTVDIINGVNLSRAYNDAMLPYKDDYVNGSMRIVKPVKISGGLRTEAINSYPVAKLKSILQISTTNFDVRDIYDAQIKLRGNIQTTLPAVQALPSEYMYLEESKSLQIQVPNSIETSVLKTKDFVLLHITGEEPGESCGLPSNCRCPTQHTIEVSPTKSVTNIPRKGYMRVFSYDDGAMLVHVLSSSISYNTTCRTNESKVLNEVSSLSWNTFDTTTTESGFFQHPQPFAGYLRKVEFFSLNGITYAIVGVYYDPVQDTHDLDCIVLKFDDKRTTSSEIQRIPTRGVREIYILHTAQGITLIIGNSRSFKPNDDEETFILRFNEAIEQFESLRSIPFGCYHATGIVLGADSLIVLAHQTATVQVLKYYPEYDNYYLYQNFDDITEPVVGISSFYSGGFGISDAFLSIVTRDSTAYIYSYKHIAGWRLETRTKIEGVTNLVPFELSSGQSYLFVSSSMNSSLLTVVKNGPN